MTNEQGGGGQTMTTFERTYFLNGPTLNKAYCEIKSTLRGD